MYCMKQMINLILILHDADMQRCIKIWEWAKLDTYCHVVEMEPSVLDMTLGSNWNEDKRLWGEPPIAILDINLRVRLKVTLKNSF